MKYGRFFFSALGTLCVGGMIAAAVLHHGAEPDLVRIHVVANSDSPEDQAVKLRVRDAVMEAVDAYSVDAENAQEYMEALADHLPVIRAAALDALRDAGKDYGAETRVGVYRFPARSYAGGTLPAGRYMALRVELGAAAGRNWWTVMYPAMCLPVHGEMKDGEEDALCVRSWIWDRLRLLLRGGRA